MCLANRILINVGKTQLTGYNSQNKIDSTVQISKFPELYYGAILLKEILLARTAKVLLAVLRKVTVTLSRM